jgi:hypothetical protein
MIRPALLYGEKEIRVSYDILVKDTEFNLFLTNKRLILLNDTKKMNLEIRLKDIVGSGFWEAENGDPIIALHVMRVNKEARQLLMQFPQNVEDDRKDETEFLYHYIHASYSSGKIEGDPSELLFTDGDEGQDGSHRPALVKCKHCKKQVRKNANYCIYCGKQYIPSAAEPSPGKGFLSWFLEDKKKGSKDNVTTPVVQKPKSSFSIKKFFSKNKGLETKNSQ